VDRFAVGGEEQQAGGVHVEAADVGEAGGLGYEIEDRAAAFLVVGSGDHAHRLVKGEPAAGELLHRTPRHGDPLPVRVHLHPQRGDRAVHPHPALLDQLLGGPA
jgi:hypothetical protein